jgi:hypothetical protein
MFLSAHNFSEPSANNNKTQPEHPQVGPNLNRHQKPQTQRLVALAAIRTVIVVMVVPMTMSNSDHHLRIRCGYQRREEQQSEKTERDLLHTTSDVPRALRVVIEIPNVRPITRPGFWLPANAC